MAHILNLLKQNKFWTWLYFVILNFIVWRHGFILLVSSSLFGGRNVTDSGLTFSLSTFFLAQLLVKAGESVIICPQNLPQAGLGFVEWEWSTGLTPS